MRVLITEDEKRLADALKHLSEGQNYMTAVAYTGPDGEKREG